MCHVHSCSESAAYLIQGYKNGGTCSDVLPNLFLQPLHASNSHRTWSCWSQSTFVPLVTVFTFQWTHRESASKFFTGREWPGIWWKPREPMEAPLSSRTQKTPKQTEFKETEKWVSWMSYKNQCVLWLTLLLLAAAQPPSRSWVVAYQRLSLSLETSVISSTMLTNISFAWPVSLMTLTSMTCTKMKRQWSNYSEFNRVSRRVSLMSHVFVCWIWLMDHMIPTGRPAITEHSRNIRKMGIYLGALAYLTLT